MCLPCASYLVRSEGVDGEQGSLQQHVLLLGFEMRLPGLGVRPEASQVLLHVGPHLGRGKGGKYIVIKFGGLMRNFCPGVDVAFNR